MRRGFTLVELSIVLVIIGLLIGGILVAQSMIDTARIQSQIRQYQALDTAVNNFITSYKYLPGDCPICGDSTIMVAPLASVAGNNMLESGSVQYGSDAEQCQGIYVNSGRECLEFWPQMVRMNMAPYSNEYTDVITYDGSRNPSPHWAWGGNGSGFMWSQPQLSIAKTETIIEVNWTKNGGLFWSAANNAGAQPPQPFTNIQALAIDTKIDDGIGDSGNVRSIGYFPPTSNDFIFPKATGNDAQCGYSGDCCYDAATANHYIMTAGKTCGLSVKAETYK